VLNKPVEIQDEYQLTASSQVVSESLLLLHFILASIPRGGNPARIASELLTAFIPNKSFKYEEIVFDLTTDNLISKYTADMTDFVKNIERLVLFKCISISLDIYCI
jgi:hypothetical protein